MRTGIRPTKVTGSGVLAMLGLGMQGYSIAAGLQETHPLAQRLLFWASMVALAAAVILMGIWAVSRWRRRHEQEQPNVQGRTGVHASERAKVRFKDRARISGQDVAVRATDNAKVDFEDDSQVE